MPDNLKHFTENFDEIAPQCLLLTNADDPKAASRTLREAYLPYNTIDVRSFNNLNYLFADAIIGFSVQFVHFVSEYTNLYYYKFSYIGRYSLFYYPNDRPYGTHHGDDIQYVIYSNYLSKLFNTSGPESLMVERMTRIWEQFAWTGNPNNLSDEVLSEMYWPKQTNPIWTFTLNVTLFGTILILVFQAQYRSNL